MEISSSLPPSAPPPAQRPSSTAGTPAAPPPSEAPSSAPPRDTATVSPEARSSETPGASSGLLQGFAANYGTDDSPATGSESSKRADKPGDGFRRKFWGKVGSVVGARLGMVGGPVGMAIGRKLGQAAGEGVGDTFSGRDNEPNRFNKAQRRYRKALRER